MKKDIALVGLLIGILIGLFFFVWNDQDNIGYRFECPGMPPFELTMVPGTGFVNKIGQKVSPPKSCLRTELKRFKN